MRGSPIDGGRRPEAGRRQLPPRWRRWAHLLQIGFALVLVASFFPNAALAAGGSNVEEGLLHQAQGNPDHTFRVLVLRQGKDTRADDYVAAKGHPKLEDVGQVGFVVEVKGKDLADLGKHPAVKHVAIDAQMTSTDDGSWCSAPLGTCNLGTLYPLVVRADDVWNNNSTSGNGIGVAIVDSGINAGLGDFGNSSGPGRVVAQAHFGASATQTDDYGHGTHVAGIVAGDSWYGGTAVRGKYLGVAPRANLVDVKVSDANGMAYISDVINGIDWAIANRQTYNIRVLNLSLLSSVAESYTTSALDAEVERAWFNGILVVVSAGNAGPNTALYPPANDPFVVTVGAADPMNTPWASGNTLAPWSSYGTSQDGYSKPDVVAPGRYITSLLASPTEGLAQRFSSAIVDGNYLTLSGTSMAAPVVSGAAALIFQAHPTWTNDQVKWMLGHTARTLGASVGGVFTPYPGQGAGEIDARASVSYSSTPGYANQNQTISTLLVGPNGQTVYTNTISLAGASSSWSTSSWSTSSWSTTASASSSWSTSSWSTASSTSSTWK